MTAIDETTRLGILAGLLQPGDLVTVFLADLRPDWMRDAACAEHARSIWFPGPKDKRSGVAARRICNRCPVAGECLDYAMADPELVGIWAGTSETQRRAMRSNAARRARRAARSPD